MVELVSEFAHSICRAAQGGDGFAANFGDDSGVNVGGRVSDFHLDELDGLFNALADSAGGRWRIAAHSGQPQCGLDRAKNPLPV